MNSKIDNQLATALELEEKVRENTFDLQTGYDPQADSWELIVKYYGDIESAIQEFTTEIRILLSNFAIVTLPAQNVERLAAIPEVIAIEKPRKLYFSDMYAKEASCIEASFLQSENLTGEGVITAFIDSGIDYSHPEFLDETGKTRILEIYDENENRIYTAQEIDNAIEEGIELTGYDSNGHGTHIASVAAGSNIGVARRASIIVVKLGSDNYYNSARLMEGIDYVIRRAIEYGMPVVINISNGNNYGSHDGNGVLEQYIDAVAYIWRCSIVIACGNDASINRHAGGIVEDVTIKESFAVGRFESFLDIQIWKNYVDDFLVELVYPDGNRLQVSKTFGEVSKAVYRQTSIYVYYGEPSPFSINQQILIQMIGNNGYINSGLYFIELIPVNIKFGEYNMWMSANPVSKDTAFINSNPFTTLTIPSTALNAVSVGAYNSATNAYADFSGRGYTVGIMTVKPDIMAPGVNITGAKNGGGYVTRTGTSVAAPFVTGSAAIIMEWGIVRGNDLYMYGEKLKAVLLRGAVPLPGISIPSANAGWGKLCLKNSIHKITI